MSCYLMNILEGKSDSKELAEVLCSAAIRVRDPIQSYCKDFLQYGHKF